jgi:NhaP-type Na+/H+ or K+/H+ antiporter
VAVARWSREGDLITLAIVATVLVAFALVSHRSSRWVSGPIIFLTFGILLSEPFLGWFTLELNGVMAQVLLKGALALLLFSEAITLRVSELRSGAVLPARLLGIGMPLVMGLGLAAAATMFSEFSFWEAAIVGVILAPTDAALGLPVIEDKRVPIRVRSGLIAESGLNDGLAVPFALFAAGAAEVVQGLRTAPDLVELLLLQIGVGVLVGVGVGWLAAKAVRAAVDRRWVEDAWIQLALLGIAVLAFALAEGLGGNGFIATWLAGLVLGHFAGEDIAAKREFTANAGHLLVALTFLVFGAISVGPLLGALRWDVVVYAALSLAVIRPIAVWIALIGTRERLPTTAFIGWFGPRGIASIVILLIILKGEYAILEIGLIDEIIAATVALSVYAHGFTAGPLSDRYADWVERTEGSVPDGGGSDRG